MTEYDRIYVKAEAEVKALYAEADAYSEMLYPDATEWHERNVFVFNFVFERMKATSFFLHPTATEPEKTPSEIAEILSDVVDVCGDPWGE